MLQRAASNAYSWWWASHVRTKQSKWLEHNLQDMEEKVTSVLKLIEEDGDSFAKRAEMYYKKRPELISFVEESYRAYRALAERYDHISTELQKANNTIAYVFPEQVQFAMEEEEDEPSSPRTGPKKISVPDVFKGANIPKVPKIPKEKKGLFSSDKKKASKSSERAATTMAANKSGLSKHEGLKEIDKLQKEILALQTEKEFVKSSYQGGLAKYWEIENQIREMQEKVCNLKDEFGAGSVIEDDEARTLMASTALKSCEETLVQLQEKQEKSAEAAVVERHRIDDAQEKLRSFKEELLHDGAEHERPQGLKSSSEEVISGTVEKQDLNVLCEKIQKHFKVSSTSLSVTELAEKIDELVNKVISFESAVSSQTVLRERLKSEIDELHGQIRALQDEKAALISGKHDLREKLKEMEEKLQGIQYLNRKVEKQNINLQTHFTEAHCNLDHLAEKLHNVTPDKELQVLSKMKVNTVKLKEEKRANKDKKEKEKKGVKSKEEQKGGEDASTPEELQIETSDSKVNSSDQSSKEVNGAEAALLTEKGLEEPQNVKSDEKTEISDKSNQEFKIEAAVIPEKVLKELQKVDSDVKLDDSVKPNKELRRQVASMLDDGLEPSQTVMLDEKLNVSGQPNEELKREIVFTHNDSSQEPKNVKSKQDLKASQKEMGSSSAEAGPTIEPKHQEEKLHYSSGEQEKKEHDLSTSHSKQRETVRQPKASNDLHTSRGMRMEEDKDKQAISTQADDHSIIETQPDWKLLFINGMENREKVLLTEYTAVLRNYKEVKKKLGELENKTDNSLFDTMVQLRELKNANAKKDGQIKCLQKKLSLLQSGLNDESTALESQMKQNDVTDNKKGILMAQEQPISEIEQKFRWGIDEVLEENLDFWFRFSTQIQEIQKFDTEVKDLQSEMSKLEVRRRNQEESSSTKYSLKSDAKPLYKHLREKHAELTVWLDKGMVLKEELKSRFSSLCDIQDEIMAALKESAEDEEIKFTSHQAAKFQGEILNMKQENKRFADELQAGLDHVTSRQLAVERTLEKLNEDFKLSGEKNNPQEPSQLQHCETRSRIPLRAFIFGVKPKKQKTSIFSCMHPVFHKKV